MPITTFDGTRAVPTVNPILIRSRSGRMLATTRVAMASLFGLWTALDPIERARTGVGAVWPFAVYLLIALGLLFISYRSWWFEYRLARLAFAIDVVALVAGLYFTEAVTLDFFSAFLAFFAFLMLTSAVRWNRRSLLAIAAALMICFLLAAVLVELRGQHIDLRKFARRFSYLTILSLLFVWFGLNRHGNQPSRYVRSVCAAQGDTLEDLLTYAAKAYGASTKALSWIEEGETHPRLYGTGLVSRGPHNGTAITAPDSCNTPMLFQKICGRRLIVGEDNLLTAQTDAQCVGLIDLFPLDEGLSIPIRSRMGHGQLVLGGIKGLCSDDLFPAVHIQREIATVIDEEEVQALAGEVVMSRLRSQIATDLHDSVVQTLAGTRYRLEALKGKLEPTMMTAIDDISAIVAAEQVHVRAIIDQLRRGATLPGYRDLRQELRVLSVALASSWMIDIEAQEGGTPVILPTAMSFQLQQVFREAVANAVRHGHAQKVSVVLDGSEVGGITMIISDDGGGYPKGVVDNPPRSIAERVTGLQGTLRVVSTTDGTRIDISLPRGVKV